MGLLHSGIRVCFYELTRFSVSTFVQSLCCDGLIDYCI